MPECFAGAAGDSSTAQGYFSEEGSEIHITFADTDPDEKCL